MAFFRPADQNRPSTAASKRLHKATTWPTGPYESDLTAERTCSIGVTIHNPIPPCLTVETGSRSKSGFQRPDFSSSDCFSGKSGHEDAAETPQRRHSHRRASAASPMITAPNAAESPAGGLVSTRGFVIDPTNKHHLKDVLHKQAQDTGVLSLRRDRKSVV